MGVASLLVSSASTSATQQSRGWDRCNSGGTAMEDHTSAPPLRLDEEQGGMVAAITPSRGHRTQQTYVPQPHDMHSGMSKPT
mmetsp:Transcript_25021/g.63720  ORF Transcript_25021/g.63720 Transcript_25021/m.63720 type:complete len:82 (-) Transcript_25021:220-465(-)